MITKVEQIEARAAALPLLKKAQIYLNEREQDTIEVVDFGLGTLRSEGAQILTLVQTDRIGVKLIALQPRQTLPEHWHPPVGADPGKEETVRHLFGELFIYTEGEDTLDRGFIPEGKSECYACRHEQSMAAGAQITFAPGEKHWFQAGDRGAVLFSFSTVARDALDQFTDPNVDRITKITGE